MSTITTSSTSTSAPKSFVLPDLHAVTPFVGSFNPNYAEVAAESSQWINSHNVLSDRKRAFFLQGGSELLCAHAYPYADYERFRTTCDFVNLLFTVDEISDTIYEVHCQRVPPRFGLCSAYNLPLRTTSQQPASCPRRVAS